MPQSPIESVAGLLVLWPETGLFFDHDLSPILLGKRNKEGEMAHRWELPGGKLEEGESHREAIRREFQEELLIHPLMGPELLSVGFEHSLKRHRVSLFVLGLSHLPTRHPEHEELRMMPTREALRLPLVDSDRRLLVKLIQKFPRGFELGPPPDPA